MLFERLETRMKLWKGIALVALLLVCPSLYAQSDFTAYVSFMEMDENVFEDDVALEFDSGQGFGIGLNKFWGNHISTELAAFALRSDGVLSLEGEPIIDTGSLDMIPVTLTIQFHLGRDARF